MVARIIVDEQKEYDALILINGEAIIQDQVSIRHGYQLAANRFKVLFEYDSPKRIKSLIEIISEGAEKIKAAGYRTN